MNKILKNQQFSVFLSMFLFFIIVSCGGSGGGGTNSSDGDVLIEDVHYPGEYFGEVDEEALLNSPPVLLVKTVSNDAFIEAVPTTSPKVEIPDAVVLEETDDFLTLEAASGVDEDSLDTPLFIDGVFKGIISSVRKTASGLEVGLKNAEDVSDVYDNFDLEFRNDEFRNSAERALKRAADQGRLGRYDALNKEPLKVSIVERRGAARGNRSAGAAGDELALRIDIPEGYRVPLKSTAELNCSFSEADCTFTSQTTSTDKIKLEASPVLAGITFSTKGSYVEIGLGSYLKARYDKNAFGADQFEFELAQSAYFDSNLALSVSGELLSSDWSTEIDLLYDFEVEIAHPYSLIAKTSVVIDPNIVLGVEGKIKGTLTASSKVKRTGEVRFKYSSAGDGGENSNNVKDIPQNLDQDSVGAAIEAEGRAYVMPAIRMLPSLKFLRINVPVTFVIIRSGISLDTEIKGKINPNFIVENTGEIEKKGGDEVSLTTSLYGLIQRKWFVRAAGIDFYYSEKYTDIFKTGSLNILEWKAQLLAAPDVVVDDHVDAGKKNISFTSKNDPKLEEHLYFYYSIGDKDNPPADIPAQTIEDHPTWWKAGDDLIAVDSDSIIKARAVLYNADVSTSIWSWGTSVSQQKDFYLIDVRAPVVEPESQAFEATLDIEIIQDQGCDIYYMINENAPVLYSGPFEISEDVALTVYASAAINGAVVRSEIAVYFYEKCAAHEEVVDGKCKLPVIEIIEEEVCDGFDNNGDGQIDEGCPGEVKEELCGDGLDNNDDGQIDEGCPAEIEGCPSIYDASLGELLTWDDTGYMDVNIQDKDKDGVFEDRIFCSYYNSNSLLEHQVFYVDGEIDGVEVFYYESGALKEARPYEQGVRTGVSKYYSESGQLITETPYVDGLQHGVFKSYFESGQLRQETPYVGGKRNGVEIIYRESGIIKEETPFIDDLASGVYRYYWESGQLYEETSYLDGLTDGENKYWSSTGELTGCRIYSSGEYVGSCMP